MAVLSMTGFARVEGADDESKWFWELRSVNGRGLDVRLRLPPGCERIEGAARDRISKRLTRGNITAQLTQRRTSGNTEIVVNEQALGQIVAIAQDLQARFDMKPPTIEGLLGLRGVLEVVDVEETEAAVAARTSALLRDLDAAVDALVEARADEGRRLGGVIAQQLGRIEMLTEQVAASPARTPQAIADRLARRVEKLVADKSVDFDEARLHQEVALLATKADIEEELQRLRGHVEAARDLLTDDQATGRRLDFLTQEFNREANTLCSKSNDGDVTKLGLELKAVIEQMREQVQNIE